jgi:3-phosphoshikimate 1-carboxyvinyltransferase
MKKSIRPSALSGRLKAPASKSLMQRAVAAALLASGGSRIDNPSVCQDSRTALGLAQSLGATVLWKGEAVDIRGGLKTLGGTLDCGESGLSLRMFTPIAALTGRETVLTASGTLRTRPVDMVELPLGKLGAACSTAAGFPPVRVRGPLRGGEADVDGSLSSQFLSGLLLALPRAEIPSRLRVIGLKSKPYVDLTLKILADFAVRVNHERYQVFEIPAPQEYRAGRFRVEGDWSSAAFLLVAGLVAGPLTVSGLDPASLQADRRILQVLEECGARLSWEGDCVHVKSGPNRPFSFDASDCPDLFPPLVALACYCRGPSRIKGISRLTHKESNRGLSLCREFSKLGAHLRLEEDWMVVGPARLSGGTVDSHGDHRMALALAVAALGATGQVTISGAECVAKSYPEFFADLKKIGAEIHE